MKEDDLIKRSEQRLEYALSIRNFSDANYYQNIIEYLKEQKGESLAGSRPEGN